jgi:hypothetical protein
MFSEFRNREINILEIGIGSINPNIPSNMTGGELGRVYNPGASIRDGVNISRMQPYIVVI